MGVLRQFTSWFSGRRVDLDQRFEVLREAIHGTMSQFYKARDRKTNAIVGLKVLDIEKTAKFEERFAKLNKPSEGEIATSLHHPAIAETWEYGTTTKGQPFLVMEFFEGTVLSTLIHTHSELLQGNRLSLLRQAAEATAAVHRAGYIHRDICPRNFVVAPDGQSLKLIDFGLTVPDTPPFRQPGNRTGTPRYMAPEVVRRRPTDRRLDIFAFGVTAYELFAGQSPWPRQETTGRVAMDHDKPPVPITQHCPDIDPRLAEAIHCCLQSDPAQRPSSLEQFLDMIRDVPAGQDTAPA
ncbi:MAG: protein kinase [Planctomycetales bacterium]|nr:protein kinase [Planctomycetales bacterium]